jgi:hypothetical protein
MFVGIRDETAGIPTSISGWTHLFTAVGGSGTFGVDTGQSQVAVFYRLDSPAAPGNIAFTSAPANATAGAVINIYTPAASTAFDITHYTSVADNTQSTNYNATVGGSDLGLTSGEWLVFAEMFSSDGGTISAESIAVTGCTMGSVNIRAERAISTGNDCRLRTGDVAVSSGTSSAPPQHAYTNLQGGTGVTAFVRLREVTTISGTGASTLAGATSSASGSESIAATGSSTLAATTSAATGSETISGTATSTLAGVSSTGTGTETLPAGVGASTLAGVSAAGSGSEVISGTESSTLAGVTATGTGTETLPAGVGASTLAGVTSTASGAQVIAGSVASTLAGVTATASGSESFAGSVASTLEGATAEAYGVQLEPIVGSGASTLDDVAVEAMGIMGDLEPIGIGASTLAGATASGVGSLGIFGSSTLTLADVLADGSGSLTILGYGESTLEDCILVGSDFVFYPNPTRISGVKSQPRISKALVEGRTSKVLAASRTSTS